MIGGTRISFVIGQRWPLERTAFALGGADEAVDSLLKVEQAAYPFNPRGRGATAI
jgi:hypothetical protein